MKKLIVFAALLFLSIFTADAATTVTVDDNTSTVTVSPNPSSPVETAVIQPTTPVVIATQEHPREFEGEIIQVDYPASRILVHDTEGRDRRIIVKQGMINNYKVDDYIQVTLMADLKEAKMIHKVQDASHFDGTIVSIDSTVNQIIVRDTADQDRTVLLMPGTIVPFKAGDRVRIYVVPEYKEARLIRIVR